MLQLFINVTTVKIVNVYNKKTDKTPRSGEI